MSDFCIEPRHEALLVAENQRMRARIEQLESDLTGNLNRLTELERELYAYRVAPRPPPPLPPAMAAKAARKWWQLGA